MKSTGSSAKALVAGMVCVAAALVAGPAFAQAGPTTTTTPPLVPINNNPGLDLTGPGLAFFMAIVVGALVVLLFAPVVYGALSAARLRRRRDKFARYLVGQEKDQRFTADDFVKVMEAYGKIEGDPSASDQGAGGQGLTTTLLALATLTLVGLALVVVLVSSSTDAVDLRKTIITALVSILASISGFYFGARTAQVSAAQAQGGGGTSTAPTFISANPPKSVKTGEPYTYDFAATGSPTPTYQLVGAPDWLKIDSAKGSVSGTAPTEPATFSYSVVASNSAGSPKAGPFDVTVEQS